MSLTKLVELTSTVQAFIVAGNYERAYEESQNLKDELTRMAVKELNEIATNETV